MADFAKNLSILESSLSVAGLTDYIQVLLEEDSHLRQVWVTGEISSANSHRSGLFFTLQDLDGAATIQCVIWQSQLHQLATLPTPGEQMIVLGSIRLYPKRGSYQLTVWQAFPAGEGLRALRDRQLRQRLAAEGLFDAERKRSLPTYAQTVAVVTSPQAAAWGDIQRTLRQRHPGLRVLLSPAIVQGDRAPASIAAAIARVVQDGRAEVLILSRGGGAVEDLACFNHEQVVRAIADCPIPIIAGIGHQRDESLADLASDVCAHTPTAAAELAVPCWDDLYAEHCDRTRDLMSAIAQALAVQQDQVARLRQRLYQIHPERQVQQEHQRIVAYRQRLLIQVRQQLQQSQQRCDFLRQKLTSLDPATVLRRGYAVVRQDNGDVVRSSATLRLAQRLTVQLAQGQIEVQVTQISASDPTA